MLGEYRMLFEVHKDGSVYLAPRGSGGVKVGVMVLGQARVLARLAGYAYVIILRPVTHCVVYCLYVIHFWILGVAQSPGEGVDLGLCLLEEAEVRESGVEKVLEKEEALLFKVLQEAWRLLSLVLQEFRGEYEVLLV